ncbi:hypothetical protein [Streptomyces sp. B1I3]|uniref:hypothetical protein n=1 Tax=Streptomyces sp. B1I3 TaxID=3042264 RepID=UPI002781A4D0|nr:hypothetical protein [Streptomyces sp. B1I3]MDQ0795600.1 hypothetical protein [Streptomyces sp. B1I3]
MQNARITINHDHTSRLGNLLFGAWWWQVYMAGVGLKSGFARAEPQARAKAERAARTLARTQCGTTFRYTLPLSTERTEAP